MTDDVGTNWAGNLRYRAARLHMPATVDELQRIVSTSSRIRVLGTRHSFNDIADSDELVSLNALPADVVIHPDRGTVTCSAATTYGTLAEALRPHRLALHNLASLPHISVGGAVATATHGSGDGNGNLATAVAEIELVTSSGDVVTAARGDVDFDGMVVGLGAFGAVTRLTLDVEPEYLVAQTVYEHLDWDSFTEHFDAITAAGYSVSAFTDWTDDVAQVWVKRRVGPDDIVAPGELVGACGATADRHPLPGESAEACTAQGGVIGRWSDRLPHFRMGFTPSSGDEIQSEFHVPRSSAGPALAAMRELGAVMAPHLLISEIRTVAADVLWTSPQFATDTVSLHFTWRRHPDAVVAMLHQIEDALAPFHARPHWGKVFTATAATIAALYPRLADFVALGHRLDARGAFRNDWSERVVPG